MYKRLTEQELEFMESFYNPRVVVSCLFSHGSPRRWNDGGKCVRLRIYERPFLGFDSALEDDNRLSEKENFERRISVGTRIIICARKIGKTFIGLTANILMKLIHYSNKEMTMAAYDEKHVSKVMDAVREFMLSHGFFKSYKQRIVGNPEYKIETLNGNSLYGINETIKSKNQGENWWSHHTSINFQDEFQAETEEAYNKRVDAVSDFGSMDILCGIPLVSKISPLGRILKDKENRKNIIRLPQFVTNLFDDRTKASRIRSYGGQESHGFRINVSADLIEDAQGVFDWERLKLNLNKKRTIKRFEITKKTFKEYQKVLVLEPIHGATKTFVTSDIGDSAATEINVFGKVNNKYQLVYNITTYRLSLTKELPELMEYIFRKVNGNYISVDCTIMGKSVYEILAERLNEKVLDDEGKVIKLIKRVYWVAFNEDVITGIEKDEKTGKALRTAKGELINKKEPTLHFSVTRLQQLFYDKKFDIPEDDMKFEIQFQAYVGIISGNRIIYSSTAEDHYVQAFEVFAILEWLTEQLPTVSAVSESKKTGLGAY